AGTCTPLWTASGLVADATPAVAGGRVFVDGGDLEAFDATGVTNCSSTTPKTCTPLWTGTIGQNLAESIAVANGVVYVRAGDLKLYGFDAAGQNNCDTTTATCSPLLVTDPTDGSHSGPVVANGVVYLGSSTGVDAFVPGSGSG